ncbi:hypothetical protein AVME950_00355 [Acidovorax sp. SUPP950]|uniref:hypothetical protein n=1 Tax=Acidovorax sp. SUPP950 TaxID=511901 RepID=UPI0023D753AD|nr:hypothetical protein [Acidovorax sp. SUPP950]GKS73289.1 hypothetical protein AVME950_00355 [Acidovorax sp. SUPP950]
MNETEAFEARYRYLVQLNSARSVGELAAARAAELALQALRPELAGLDLCSCSGWMAGAKALLCGLPPGSALVDAACDGLVVLIEGEVVGLPQLMNAASAYHTENGYPVLGRDAGEHHWDGEKKCWEAHRPAHARDVLLLPSWTTVQFVEVV